MFRILMACAALAIAACATTAQPTPTASKAVAQKPPCIPGTVEATRLPQTACGPGSTYDQKDISATGQKSEPAAALKTLDPRIIAH
jgi:hypothetical protein